MATNRFRLARWTALLLPAALIAGAWGFQLIGGLVPCEMCHWQRWPHYAAILLAGLSFLALRRHAAGPLILLAAIAIAFSGAIGVLQAGAEYHWWSDVTACTSTFGAGADFTAMMHAPIVRCDVAQWTLFGISLAGYNAILSLAGAATIVWLLARARRT